MNEDMCCEGTDAPMTMDPKFLALERSLAANRNTAHCGPRRVETSANVPTPRSEGSTSAQIDLLAAEISKLDKSFDILLEKISPVIIQAPERVDEGAFPEEAADSHIARIIRDNKNEVMRISAKIRWIANHVDVIVY